VAQFTMLPMGLVVSCQALENEPLHGGDTMRNTGFSVFITPTFNEVAAILEAGADIVAKELHGVFRDFVL
jgi:putative N-acetylmannosamine-6-phosphate epimerase